MSSMEALAWEVWEEVQFMAWSERSVRKETELAMWLNQDLEEVPA